MVIPHRILQDHSHSSGMHGQALDSMKEKLEEAEATVRREQEAYRLAQVIVGSALCYFKIFICIMEMETSA